MNDNMNDNGGRSNQALLGFLCGAAVGAGIALLTAPATGADTRRRLADGTRQQLDRVRNRLGEVRDDLKDSVKRGIDEMNSSSTR